MQGNEMYISKTPTDDIKWDNQATADGFPSKSVAYRGPGIGVPTAQAIVGYFESAFTQTPCILTLARPWADDNIGDADKNAVNSAMHTLYPGWYGEMIASSKATLPPHGNNVIQIGYPKIGQAVSPSSNQALFYAVPPVPYPTPPQPVDDLLREAQQQGRQGVEVYPDDLRDPTNDPKIAQDRLFLYANAGLTPTPTPTP
jgi:hypothetical protein